MANGQLLASIVTETEQWPLRIMVEDMSCQRVREQDAYVFSLTNARPGSYACDIGTETCGGLHMLSAALDVL